MGYDLRGDPHAVSTEPENLFERLWHIASTGSGERVAVSDARSTLTYAELATLSSAFATQLAEAGVQPRDPVGVVLGNCREFLIAAFGSWKHGAVLVPLNPLITEPELLKYVVDCQLRALITATRNTSLVQALEGKGAPIEHVWLCPLESDEWQYRSRPIANAPCDLIENALRNRGEGARHGPAESAPRGQSGRELHGQARRAFGFEAASEWPAIIQYSTGSTGYPKRVTRSHAQLIGEFTSVSDVLRVAPGERVLGVAPFFHSHGLMNSAMQTLLSGGALHVVNSFLPRDVARLIAREGIAGFPGVPFMFDQLADLPDTHDFSSIRFAISAGASLSEKTAHAFAEKYAITIRQLYGTTETGVIAIQSENANAEVLSVGKPVAGVSVRVVDDADNLVAAGTAGRVEITSPFAALAYDNTAGNEESYFAAGRFYPGDVGRLSADGELTLCGRHRGFINVGGNKVDPTEIEVVLRNLPGITEAVVFGISDGATSEKIKAVLASPDGVSRMAVRAHCARHLAEFKHPDVIEIRKELPKSPLGKILRKYLMDEGSNGRPGYVFSATGSDPFDLATLPPFLRVLLVTDGTVTKNIEAYFLEPIEVEVLAHAYTTSDRDYHDINVVPGDPILRRCVILRGKFTRSAYAFAESIMACNHVPADMKRKLIEDRKGIGELLRETQKETYRELSRVKQTDAGEWAIHLGVDKTASVVTRDYKIHLDGCAVIHIEEVFPIARFRSST
jgi:long-chain acyl-CoA synthetase